MRIQAIKGGLALLSATVALALMLAAPASAAGEIGPYRGADVYCSNGAYNFGQSKLEVTAYVSRYLGFSSQVVAYRHRLKNVYTNQVWDLSITTNNPWYAFLDNRTYINSGWPYALGEFFSWNSPVPPGSYILETKYAWANGSWTYSPWIRASAYNGFTSKYCEL